MKLGVMVFQWDLGEVQLIPFDSFSLSLSFPLLHFPFLWSFSIHSSELEIGQIFSKESDVRFHVLSSFVWVLHVFHCAKPTCRPGNTLQSKLTQYAFSQWAAKRMRSLHEVRGNVSIIATHHIHQTTTYLLSDNISAEERFKSY